MVLGKLFGSTATVEVDVDRREAGAGETVTATVRLAGIDDSVRGGHVELRYRNSYTETDVDSDGDRHVKGCYSDVSVDRRQLFDGQPADGEHRFTFTLPEGPASSGDLRKWKAAEGACREEAIIWSIDAGLDVPKKRDPTASAILKVHSAPAPTTEELTTWATAAGSDDCRIEVMVDDRAIHAGATVSGRVRIAPEDSVKATSICARLVAIRRDQEGQRPSAILVEQELSSAVEIASGGVEHAFTLAVPEGAPPTFVAQENSQDAWVQVVVARRLRGDFIGGARVHLSSRAPRSRDPR